MNNSSKREQGDALCFDSAKVDYLPEKVCLIGKVA